MTTTLLKPAEVAEVLGISENGAYRLIANGQLRAVDVSQPGARTSKTRVRSDDVEEFIERRTRASPSERGEADRSRQANRRPRRRATATNHQMSTATGTSVSVAPSRKGQ